MSPSPVNENTEPAPLLEPPVAGSEADTLIGCLERQRRTLAWKCEGLDAAGMNTRLAPSTMTLGGLLKHLALVEDEYLTGRLLGKPLGAPWDAVDWDAEPDWEWRSAASDTPEELFALWESAVARSRAHVRRDLAEGGLDTPARREWPDGRAPSLRRMLVDLIEEYSRHVGHADLVRESVDGRVGEDPPR
ncbi:DinB family protein [Streptomyces sp. NPDC002143]